MCICICRYACVHTHIVSRYHTHIIMYVITCFHHVFPALSHCRPEDSGWKDLRVGQSLYVHYYLSARLTSLLNIEAASMEPAKHLG